VAFCAKPFSANPLIVMQTAKASTAIRFIIRLLKTGEHFRMRGAVAPNRKTKLTEKIGRDAACQVWAAGDGRPAPTA
jgi:hypothetical protein